MNGISQTARRMLSRARRQLRYKLADMHLPAGARAEFLRDKAGLPTEDPGADSVIEACIGWACRAQDNSWSQDGGVARHYSLLTGWSDSYPETTGYLVPSMLAYAEMRDDTEILERTRRMLDFLVAQQCPCGGFSGGTVRQNTRVPVTFNTGQILFGLVAGARVFGQKYEAPMRRAADWLVETQDNDGCWRKFPTLFVESGEKVYETHVAWALAETARITGEFSYGRAALANARWALRFQQGNGWFEHCCLDDPARPLTHTLGYVLRGILEVYQYTNEKSLLMAARRTADGLRGAMRKDGFLPGRLDRNWRPAANWSCLTGTAQIACCWLLLGGITGDPSYCDAAFAANSYLRRTIAIDGPAEARGGVKGSFPIYGGYNRYQYINWACKFAIDANLMEKAVRQSQLALAG